MEEIQSLVDISHIVPPMKMGKAAVCGYRRYRYGAATRSVASPERYGAMLSYSCRSLECSVSIKAMEYCSVGSY
jgi:hypothetical protein